MKKNKIGAFGHPIYGKGFAKMHSNSNNCDMKKPDKTYPLSVVTDLVKQMPYKLFAHIGTHAGQITTTVIPTNVEGEQVFISKGTLLEWLYAEKKKLDKTDNAQKDDVQMGASYAVEAFIDKINSL